MYCSLERRIADAHPVTSKGNPMANLTFIAIDVETANRDRASICQIGIAHVRMGNISKVLSILVDPEEHFEHRNTGIHGIDEGTVKDADTMSSIYPKIWRLVEGATLVSHTTFDQQALDRAASKYGLPLLQVKWLDSAQIAHSAWPEKYGRGGRSLKKIATDLSIEFQHHDAGEDARVAAEILLHACRHTGLDVDDWLEQAGYDRSTITHPVSGQMHRANRKGETTKGMCRSTVKRLLAGPLVRILVMEEHRGFDNSSVVGGMDQFMHRWAGAIMEELGDSGIHRVLLSIPYMDLTHEERSWWVEQWLRVIVQWKQLTEVPDVKPPTR